MKKVKTKRIGELPPPPAIMEPKAFHKIHFKNSLRNEERIELQQSYPVPFQINNMGKYIKSEEIKNEQ